MNTNRLVFDVDGTLTDTNHLHVVTWWEALRQAGTRSPCTPSTGRSACPAKTSSTTSWARTATAPTTTG